MAPITSPVPEIGASNGSEQVDTTNLLQELKNALNGGLALDNFSTLLQQIVNPPIVTALPGSPVAGQRVRLRAARAGVDVGDTENPTPGPLWPLRYNPDAAGSFKWEADGEGSALATGPGVGAGFVTGVGSAYAGFSAWNITVPVTGVYNVRAGGRVDNDTILILTRNSAFVEDWIIARNGGVDGRLFPNIQLAAGDKLAFAHRSPSGGAVGSNSYWVHVTPVRVGT